MCVKVDSSISKSVNTGASLIAQLLRNLLLCRRPWFNSWIGKMCWTSDRPPTPVFWGFPGGSAGKESTCSAGDLGSIPGLGRSTGEGNSYPLQYSGLENAMDSIVDGVTKSGTQPSNFHFTAQLLSEFLEAPYIFLFLNGRILGGITVFYV